MRPVIDHLLQLLENPDTSKDDVSALELSLLLESSSRGCGAKTSIELDLLPPNLRSITLDDGEQTEIMDRVFSMISRSDNMKWPELFCIASKAMPEIVFPRVVQAIHALSSLFDEETAIQALFALHNCVSDESLLSRHAELLKEHDITEFLERMNNPSVYRRMNTVSRDLERIRQVMDR